MNSSTVTTRAWTFLAVTLLVGLPALVSAQTSIDACYVDKTGVIYRIDPSGTLPGDLLTACVKPDKHIQFRWVDGEGAAHGSLAGLSGDDHLQYLPLDGTRGMTGKLTTTDKIGIGTAVPGAPLEILHSTIDDTQPHLLLNSGNGSGQNTIQFQHDGRLHSRIRAAGSGDLFIGTHQNAEIRFYTREEIRMVLSSEGNVGIGTLDPGQRLSVAGMVESTEGGFMFPDGSVQTKAAASEITIVQQTQDVPAGLAMSSIALGCHSAGTVIGGGFQWYGTEGETHAAFPDPSDMYGQRYIWTGSNPTDSPLRLTVYAVCMK